MFNYRGIGGASRGILSLLIETPYLAYAFLVALIACLLFYMLDKHKLVGVVQIIIAVCIAGVFIFRNAQGHGWDYALVWGFGVIGCVTYWLSTQINKEYSTF